MKILIIGSGGREHALATCLASSPDSPKIFCAPGNPGTALLGTNVDIASDDIRGLLEFARREKIDLTVVGPEKPLILGIADVFCDNGLAILGPQKLAAQLEGSKSFTKDFAQRHHLPTANYQTFSQVQTALDFLDQRKNFPVVIKADGLAAGKGVVIANSRDHAKKTIQEMMVTKIFGSAGNQVVIEDFLSGEEASFILLTDGKNWIDFPAAQDHKRVFEDDQGPNTGGMGAYAPAPIVTKEIRDRIVKHLVEPTLTGLQNENIPYCGFLYFGLMISEEGNPSLIEFNCRFGDPEAEVLLPLLTGNTAKLFLSAAQNNLDTSLATFKKSFCSGVVLASGGYPGEFKTGILIPNLQSPVNTQQILFHCGTQKTDTGFITAGGRVLVACGLGDTLKNSLDQAYALSQTVAWAGAHYRKDIGKKGL